MKKHTRATLFAFPGDLTAVIVEKETCANGFLGRDLHHECTILKDLRYSNVMRGRISLTGIDRIRRLIHNEI